MLRPGKLARYYAGLCEVDLGNLPEADQQLTAAVAGGDSYVQPLARLALAGVQARENKAADAEQTFRYLGNGGNGVGLDLTNCFSQRLLRTKSSTPGRPHFPTPFPGRSGSPAQELNQEARKEPAPGAHR